PEAGRGEGRSAAAASRCACACTCTGQALAEEAPRPPAEGRPVDSHAVVLKIVSNSRRVDGRQHAEAETRAWDRGVFVRRPVRAGALTRAVRAVAPGARHVRPGARRPL